MVKGIVRDGNDDRRRVWDDDDDKRKGWVR